MVEEAQRVYPLRRLNALNTVGYKELFSYFDGDIDFAEAVRLIQRNSRHYARKQLPIPIGGCCRKSCPLLIVLRHRTPSSPPRYASPKWYESPSPYREYSSYPAEEKYHSREEKSAFA